jgi:predicted phage tail protein
MTIPGPPINFSTSLSSGTLSAAWDASPIGAAPEQYRIQASTSSDFSNLLAEIPTGLARTFSVPGVPPGVFHVRVVARNAAGYSGPSNAQVIGVPATQLPGAPSNLVANVNGNMLTLTWSAPSTGGAPTTYFIDAGATSGSSNIASFPTGNTQTSLTVTAPGGLYFVRLRAGNAVGVSVASSEVSFRIGPEPCTIPPRNPTNLQASVSGGVVTLMWTPPTGPGLTRYRLEAGSAAGLSNLAVIEIGPTTTFSVSAPRGTYFVRMISLSACGASNPSPDVTVVVP